MTERQLAIRHICLWVTVVRHAETELTRAHPRILQGQTDYPLNENGVRQAEALAWRLAKETFTHIMSSDLARAKGTTEAIARYHPGVPVTYDKRLREKDLGDLAGTAWPNAKELLRKEGLSLDDHVSRTGETPKQFEDRVVGFYSDLVERFLLDPNRVDYTELEQNLAKLGNQPLATPVGTEPPRTAGRRESLLANVGDLLAKQLEVAGINTPQQSASAVPQSPANGHLKPLRREQQIPTSVAESDEKAEDTPENKQMHRRLSPQVTVNHVLVVSHGGTIQELLGHIVGELGFAVCGPPPTGFPKNTGTSRFVISRVNKSDGDYEWEGRLTLYNCVSHLAGFGKRGHGLAKTSQDPRKASPWGIPAWLPQQHPAEFRPITNSTPAPPQGESPPPALRSAALLPGADAGAAPIKEEEQVPGRIHSSASRVSKSPRIKNAIMTAGSKLFGGGRKEDRPASPISPGNQSGIAIIGNVPVPNQAPRMSGSKGKSLGW